MLNTIKEILLEIDPNTIEAIIQIFLSFIAGFLIGLEREKSGHPAGLKTHILVCVGACLVMIISMNAFSSGDPARLAAQVVSGMGFIGAGAIMRDNSGGIKGITTAATLWVTACVGLGLGSGMYIVTFVVVVIVALSLIFVKQIEAKLIRKNVIVTLICESNQLIANIAIKVFNENNIEIKDLVITPILKGESDSYSKVIITLLAKNKMEPNVQVAISSLRKELSPKSFHVKHL